MTITGTKRRHAIHGDQPKPMVAAVDEIVAMVCTGKVAMVARGRAWVPASVVSDGGNRVS
jgi:hypothetical protein